MLLRQTFLCCTHALVVPSVRKLDEHDMSRLQPDCKNSRHNVKVKNMRSEQGCTHLCLTCVLTGPEGVAARGVGAHQ